MRILVYFLPAFVILKMATCGEETAPCGGLEIDGNCYFTHMNLREDINFARAQQICSEKNAYVAVIPNSNVYGKLMKDLTAKLKNQGIGTTATWTAMTVEKNGNVSPPGTYINWMPSFPATGFAWSKDGTQIALQITTNPRWGEGMENLDPSGGRNKHGVICQLTKKEDTVTPATAPPMEMTTAHPMETTTTPPMENTTEGSETCAEGFEIDGNCYITHMDIFEAINFAKAQQICSEKNAYVAVIPNSNVYEELMKDLTAKFEKQSMGTTLAWTAMTVEKNGNVSPTGTYVEWMKKGFFGIGFSGSEHDTQIALQIATDPEYGEGMTNMDPSAEENNHGVLNHGVICQFTKPGTVITTSTPDIETTTKGSELCEGLEIDGNCYITHMNLHKDINYARAQQICSEKNANVAVIPDSNVYGKLMKDLTAKLKNQGIGTAATWTAMTVKKNGDVSPPGTYINWMSSFPATGFAWSQDGTQIALQITTNPRWGEGMENLDPSEGRNKHGVICQLTKEEVTVTTTLATVMETTTKKPWWLEIDGNCYFTHVNILENINYPTSQQICSEKNAYVATIPNRNVYEGLMNDLSEKFKEQSMGTSLAWTAMTVEKNGKVSPIGSYVEWMEGFPNIEFLQRANAIQVALQFADEAEYGVGMTNRDPREEWGSTGVVCQLKNCTSDA